MPEYAESLRSALSRFPPGTAAVQLREKTAAPARQLRMARIAVEICSQFGHLCVINSRVDLALSAGAHGVHLPLDGLPWAETRKAFPDLLIGCSTHNLSELGTAISAGADFVTFGPVFPTPSKAKYGAPVGVDALRNACRSSVRVFGLGGVTSSNARLVREAGAGIACIRAAWDGSTLR